MTLHLAIDMAEKAQTCHALDPAPCCPYACAHMLNPDLYSYVFLHLGFWRPLCLCHSEQQLVVEVARQPAHCAS